MRRYVAGRLVETLVVLALMSYLIYGLIGLMPGDPIDVMVQADPDLTPADAARLKALYGLDRPLHERYVNWLAAAFRGDFGFSRVHSAPVLEVLAPRLVNTLVLMGLSFVVSLAIAVQRARLRGQFRGPSRHLGAGLLAGPHADLSVRRAVGRVARRRHGHHRRRRTARQGRLSGAAGGDPQRGERRRLYPLRARLDHGNHAPRLHPHRPRQGAARKQSGVRARAAERADPGGDDHGALLANLAADVCYAWLDPRISYRREAPA